MIFLFDHRFINPSTFNKKKLSLKSDLHQESDTCNTTLLLVLLVT